MKLIEKAKLCDSSSTPRLRGRHPELGEGSTTETRRAHSDTEAWLTGRVSISFDDEFFQHTLKRSDCRQGRELKAHRSQLAASLLNVLFFQAGGNFFSIRITNGNIGVPYFYIVAFEEFYFAS